MIVFLLDTFVRSRNGLVHARPKGESRDLSRCASIASDYRHRLLAGVVESLQPNTMFCDVLVFIASSDSR
jgi:hypothetical protein